MVTHHQFTVRLRVQYDGSPPACQLIRQQHLEAPLLQVLHLHTHHPHLVCQAHGHGAGWGLPRWLQSNKESCISHFIDLHIKMAVAKHRHTISFPMQNSLFCIKYNVITLAYQRISMQSCVASAVHCTSGHTSTLLCPVKCSASTHQYFLKAQTFKVCITVHIVSMCACSHPCTR